ncbi:MAG: ASKHA domain-containing protein [Ignisphaera sp.]|nr:ASKHA domain-containing protein [Ignisphaera sp.]MDW8084645.1 ASKHA domain-containing protein [Ignisphaera sp.]
MSSSAIDMNRNVVVMAKQYDKTLITIHNRVLLDVLRELEIPLRSDCGGIGVCGKCKVLITGGNSTQPTSSERKLLSYKELSEGYRLACQVRLIEGEFEVSVPPESTLQRYKSADTGFERPVPLLPAIKKIFVTLPRASLNDTRADFERIVDTVKDFINSNDIDIDIDDIRKIPETIRNSDWKVTIVAWYDKRIIDVEAGDTRDSAYGLAIDIGTSKIVVHLIDLTNGSTIAIDSTPNPQASYGADIISRLTYALKDDENLRRLQEVVIKAVNVVIDRILSRANVLKDRVYEAVVVGNTVMHHLFLGIQPKYLGYSPYVPTIARALSIRAKDLGISIHRSGTIYVLPVIAGYVGSDALADALAIDIENCEAPCMLIDIGTNSEILLNSGKEIIACSTPAGPAFEGFGTAFGTRAVSGAIDQVFIYFDSSIQDFVVRYHTIGGEKPVGLCGSAFIDATAHLYRLNIINNRGRFLKGIKSKRIVEINNTPSFILAWSNETKIGKDISIDAKDINEILLAKAAIAAGIRILAKSANIDLTDIKKIYIAGSFGTYMNVENAVTIGLLPSIDTKKVEFVGNIAIGGAKMCLKNTEIRRKAEELARRIKYIELSTYPSFNKIFMESILLPQITSRNQESSLQNGG